ncbi:MAG TPA: hypothetical protein VF809_02990 [Candidatus Saccharimonadales bacterium]
MAGFRSPEAIHVVGRDEVLDQLSRVEDVRTLKLRAGAEPLAMNLTNDRVAVLASTHRYDRDGAGRNIEPPTHKVELRAVLVPPAESDGLLGVVHVCRVSQPLGHLVLTSFGRYNDDPARGLGIISAEPDLSASNDHSQIDFETIPGNSSVRLGYGDADPSQTLDLMVAPRTVNGSVLEIPVGMWLPPIDDPHMAQVFEL